MNDALDEALLDIVGHLAAAKGQRAATDDQIIAAHIDAALEIARLARRARSDERIISAHMEDVRATLNKLVERAS